VQPGERIGDGGIRLRAGRLIEVAVVYPGCLETISTRFPSGSRSNAAVVVAGRACTDSRTR
jgi:hypothetical protein